MQVSKAKEALGFASTKALGQKKQDASTGMAKRAASHSFIWDCLDEALIQERPLETPPPFLSGALPLFLPRCLLQEQSKPTLILVTERHMGRYPWS